MPPAASAQTRTAPSLPAPDVDEFMPFVPEKSTQESHFGQTILQTICEYHISHAYRRPLPVVPVDHLVERPPIQLSDRSQRPVSRITEPDQSPVDSPRPGHHRGAPLPSQPFLNRRKLILTGCDL